MSEPNNLAKSMEAAAGPRVVTESSDFDRLMASGAKLLKSKIDEHLKVVSAYEARRVELIDSYRVRIERLRIEAEEQLRELEQAHAARIAGIERTITALKGLRGE
jgi:hypothetical protein